MQTNMQLYAATKKSAKNIAHSIAKVLVIVQWLVHV